MKTLIQDLFTVEIDGHIIVFNTANMCLCMPHSGEEKEYTQISFTNGQVISRIPGSPDHFRDVMNRQREYRAKDYPPGYGPIQLS